MAFVAWVSGEKQVHNLAMELGSKPYTPPPQKTLWIQPEYILTLPDIQKLWNVSSNYLNPVYNLATLNPNLQTLKNSEPFPEYTLTLSITGLYNDPRRPWVADPGGDRATAGEWEAGPQPGHGARLDASALWDRDASARGICIFI